MIRCLFSGLMASLALWCAAAGQALASDAGAPDPSAQVLVFLRAPPDHFTPGVAFAGGYGDSLGHAARRRLAVRLARAHGVNLVEDWPIPLVGMDCFVLSTPAGRSPQDLAAALSSEPAVAWSEPVAMFRAQGGSVAHNDPLFPFQPAARVWRLSDLHEISTGRSVRVAVIDSMVDLAHPDLVGQVLVSENFASGRPETAEQHGTGVAGIIAARADNGVGIAGVAPRARLLALRACWQQQGRLAEAPSTVCDSLSLAKALSFAIDHNAQVINLSLSGPSDLLLSKLIDVALARGAVVVGAYDPALAGGGFPASHAGVVAVSDEPQPGASGVFLAPGREVPTTQPGGRWFLVNGSSYAAAHVSGLFALVRARSPGARGGAVLTTAPASRTIDACATLLRAAGDCDCACARSAGPTRVAGG
jgi:subtilisin family serine protease